MISETNEDADAPTPVENLPEPGTSDSEDGVVYVVDGENTSSGLDYVGTANDKAVRARDRSDGRNREGAPTVATYPKADRAARQEADQKAMNERGGKDKLDNKRNEVAEKKWADRKIDPPQE